MIIATIGGSGSEHLITRLRACGWKVGYRPDVVILPPDKQPFSGTYHHQAKSLAERPQLPALKQFSERAGHKASGDSWAEVLSEYLAWAQRESKYAAVMARTHMWRFYTKYSIPNVIYQIRDPSQAYLSHCKEGRNNADWESVGWRTLASVRMFLDEWRFLKVESMTSPGARVVRFENAISDGEACGLAEVYAGWLEDKRNETPPWIDELIPLLIGEL